MRKSSRKSGFPQGTVIDNRYKILKLLGAGGFSEVYKARHIQMERDVALKIVSQYLGEDDPHYMERFQREAQIGAQLTHPNAVLIYDFGKVEETQQPYIAMEFLHGHDLATEIRKNGPLSPSRVFTLFRPVLEVLGEGHDLGIVHRDLKPENLFLINPGTPKEVLKVVDFGIAGVTCPSMRLTATGQMLGTPRYYAPEYIKTQCIVPTIDVYQMALIFSEALSGYPAVEDNSMAALLCHVEGGLEICDFLKTGEVGEVFKKALCIDSQKRYQNCVEFGAALDAVKDFFFSEQPPSLAKVPNEISNQGNDVSSSRTEKKRKDHFAFVFVLLLLVLIGICAGAYYYYLKGGFDGLKLLLSGNPFEAVVSNVNEGAPAQEKSFVEKLKLPVTLDSEEVRVLKIKSSSGDDGAKESLGIYYMEQSMIRENYENAYQIFESIKEPVHEKALYYKGVIGQQHLQDAQISDLTEYRSYDDLVWESAKRHYLPAVNEVVQQGSDGRIDELLVLLFWT